MKWSLFDEKNHALLDEVQRIYGISDERLQQAKQTISEAGSIISAASYRAKLNSTPHRRHAGSRVAMIKHEVLAAAKRVEESFSTLEVFVTLPDPHRNNQVFAFSVGHTNKYGKIKVEQVAIANPEDFNAKDLVTIERDKKYKAYKIRRKKFLGIKDRVEQKNRKKVGNKLNIELPIAKKLTYDA